MWTLGLAFHTAHLWAVFHFVHHGSHAAAMDHIADRTEVAFGVRFGAGIWFNHAFFALWLLTAVVWRRFRPRPWRNADWIARLIHLYLLFVVFNGVVVFAVTPLRWPATAIFAVIAWLYFSARSGSVSRAA